MDNILYQAVTQKKSFYVKEQLGQFLVLQNLLKEKAENETLKELANVKIILPVVLYAESENTTKSTSKVSSEKPVFDDRYLLKLLQRTIAQSSIDRNNTAVSELKVLQQNFKKE